MATKTGLPYAYELYTRMLTAVRVDGTPLTELTLHGGWSAWEPAAQLALMVDLAGFAKRGEVPQTGQVSVRALCVGAVLAMWTCASVLGAIFSRVPVVVFSVDKDSAPGVIDFRIEKVYRTLNSRNTPYIEFFHTEGGIASLARMLRRKRPALYLEGLDFLYHIRTLFTTVRVPSLSGLETFTQEEAHVIRGLVTKYVRAQGLFEFRIRAVQAILKLSLVKIVIGIDDARYYHALAAAALEQSIPFYAFQHAHVTPYNVGWFRGCGGRRAHPSTIIVWNEYWKNKFLSLNSCWDEAHIIVAGSPKQDSVAGLTRGEGGAPVVVPFETEAPRDEVCALIQGLAAIHRRIIFKLRPDKTEESQLETLGDTARLVEPTLIVTEPVSAVIGTYSTYLYDALAAGIPVGVLRTDLAYARQLVESGMVVTVDRGSVPKALQELEHLSPEECARRARSTRPLDELERVLGGLLEDVA